MDFIQQRLLANIKILVIPSTKKKGKRKNGENKHYEVMFCDDNRRRPDRKNYFEHEMYPPEEYSTITDDDNVKCLPFRLDALPQGVLAMDELYDKKYNNEWASRNVHRYSWYSKGYFHHSLVDAAKTIDPTWIWAPRDNRSDDPFEGFPVKYDPNTREWCPRWNSSDEEEEENDIDDNTNHSSDSKESGHETDNDDFNHKVAKINNETRKKKKKSTTTTQGRPKRLRLAHSETMPTNAVLLRELVALRKKMNERLLNVADDGESADISSGEPDNNKLFAMISSLKAKIDEIVIP